MYFLLIQGIICTVQTSFCTCVSTPFMHLDFFLQIQFSLFQHTPCAVHLGLKSSCPCSFSGSFFWFLSSHTISYQSFNGCWFVIHESHHCNFISIKRFHSSMNDSRLSSNWQTCSDLPSSWAPTKQSQLGLLGIIFLALSLFHLKSIILFQLLFFLNLLFVIWRCLLPLVLPPDE